MDHILPHDDLYQQNIEIYNFSEPPRGLGVTSEDLLIDAIQETAAFRRLHDIRFLGALDYCLVTNPNGSQSNARFTRAQHSTGVATLAVSYLRLTSHSLQDRLLCVAAAMLHDIGHAPLSHTLEPIFKRHFGIDHHHASENIILGQHALGRDLVKILHEFGVDPYRVIAVLDGSDSQFEGFFSGPINFDTAEGILRSRSYLKMQNLGLTPTKVIEAATLRDNHRSEELVDSFWQLKNDMYGLVIRSKLGVFFDKLFQEIADQEIKSLSKEIFTQQKDICLKKYLFCVKLLGEKAGKFWEKNSFRRKSNIKSDISMLISAGAFPASKIKSVIGSRRPQAA
jgi:hypothetical protein